MGRWAPWHRDACKTGRGCSKKVRFSDPRFGYQKRAKFRPPCRKTGTRKRATKRGPKTHTKQKRNLPKIKNGAAHHRQKIHKKCSRKASHSAHPMNKAKGKGMSTLLRFSSTLIAPEVGSFPMLTPTRSRQRVKNILCLGLAMSTREEPTSMPCVSAITQNCHRLGYDSTVLSTPSVCKRVWVQHDTN